ncbi:MAG: glutamine amidotransferase [Pseudomonadota bacterium]
MNTSAFTTAPVFPLWLIALLFFIGAGLTFAQYRRIRHKLDRKSALILSALRLCAIALILTFTLNPSLLTKKEHIISPSIAVLMDTAAGMGQSDTGKRITRLDEAKALLTAGTSPLLRSLNERYEVNLYGLADSLKPLVADDLTLLKAGGNKGNVSEALSALSGRSDLAVLFSDGNVTWNETPALSPPLVTVAIGNPRDYKDILIKGVRAPTLAFRDREVIIELTIKSYGYADATFPVFFKDSETLLTSKNIRIESDAEENTVSFSFVPKTVGQKDLSISIPAQAGETITSNNQINLSVKVVRDKTRILMVSGTPSLNYRFMRTALKSDPSIDLLSFVILRTPSDIMNVRPHEQSLIPFPMETVFLKELTSFDLVLFDNFNYAFYLRPEHLESIRDFVKEGGGLGIIGGPGLFNEGSSSLSPIGDMLPFRFVEQAFYKRDAALEVRLSRAGARHPMMRFFDDFREDDTDLFRFWQDMPTLDGINPVEAKGSATVILESGDRIPWPILLVSEYGKGRVLGLTTDYAWKWYMGMVAQGKGNRHYLKLVHGMIRWLAQDPGLNPIQMILPETAVFTGQNMDIRVQFLGEDPSGAPDSAILCSVFNPEGVKIASTLKPAGRPGEYLLSFLPRAGGIYRIKVETPSGNITESMVVSGPLESLDAAPHPDRLKKIAGSTGGKFVSQRDNLFTVLEGLARKSEKTFIEEKRRPMWTTAYVTAALLGLLLAEWYFRRRWGLI